MTRPSEPAHSVRRRLLLLLLAPLMLLLGTGVFVDYVTGARPIHDAYDRALREDALAVAAHLRDEDGNGRIDADLPPQAVAVLRADSTDSIYYAVRAADGTLVSGDADLPARPLRGANPTFDDVEYRGHAIRLATYATRVGAAEVTVAVAETTRKRTLATTRILTSIVLTDLAQLVGTLVLVWVGVRYGVRPLRALGEQIAARSARDLAPLDEAPVPTEIRPLVRVLNELFDTVRAAARSQQQFLASAAHQLRTPLAGIIAQLELLARDPAAGAARERLLALHDGTRRLAHTANQLLALARAEPTATTHEDFHETELATLVAEVVSQNLDRSLAAGIDLGAETEPVRVIGSAWLLRELLANLVDNALAYTPRDGSVTVRCGRCGRGAFVEVEDDGPGIAPEQRERVRERFYRVPESPGNGCGLGLAIVDDIARAHAATFTLGDGARARGTRARVEFQRAV
ncbi:MAG TPA: sensor histidine kinase [Dokdonella sp.]